MGAGCSGGQPGCPGSSTGWREKNTAVRFLYGWWISGASGTSL